MASKRVAPAASIPRHVAALLMMLLFLAQYAAAEFVLGGVRPCNLLVSSQIGYNTILLSSSTSPPLEFWNVILKSLSGASSLTPYDVLAGDSNSKAVLLGRAHYYRDNNLHVYPRSQRSTPALDEAEDTEATSEPHPADELLQSQDADGSQSYILGGY